MNMFAHLKSKPEMLSANDLLEIFPISRSGIYDLLREPGFPCIHLGRRIIVPRDAMIDWLENRLQEELNSAAKSRESNEVSVMPETESEADTPAGGAGPRGRRLHQGSPPRHEEAAGDLSTYK